MKTNRAGALLFAIITAFVLTLVASTLVVLTTNQYKIIDSEVDRIRDFYLLQAGMEWAIYNLYTTPTGWIPTGADGSNTTHYMTLTVDGQLIGIAVDVYNLPLPLPVPVTTPNFQNISDYGIRVRFGEEGVV